MRRAAFVLGLGLVWGAMLLGGCALPAPATSAPAASPTPSLAPVIAEPTRSTGAPPATLSEAEARQIAAASECAAVGTLLDHAFYNDSTRTWWIDLEPAKTNPICNPACVVWEQERRAEVNWRCTGAVPPAATAGEPSSGVTPTLAAPAVSPAPPTRAPASQVVPPAAQQVVAPAGFATAPCTGTGLALYGLDGRSLGELAAPTTCNTWPRMVHLGGGAQTLRDLPVIFAARENGTLGLWLSRGGSPTLWAGTPEVAAIAGAPGQPVFAYATLQPAAGGAGLTTQMYVGRVPGSGGSPPAAFTETSADVRAIMPVAVHLGLREPDGVWYTHQPWGIGGEIVFDPFEGLSYLPLGDNRPAEILPAAARFAGLSADQTWVAYVLSEDTAPVLYLRSLASGAPATPTRLIPLASSDRGAGAAVFSPANRYVAWLEASGSLRDDSFHEVIRVATTGGETVAYFPAEDFYAACKTAAPTMLLPLGWTDESTLLVQCRAPGKDGTRTVVSVEPATGALRYLAPGAFIGFLYP